MKELAKLPSDTCGPLTKELVNCVAEFERLADGPGARDARVQVEGRAIRAKREAEDVVWFGFRELCEGPRSAADYIEIARCYGTVFLSGVPVLGPAQDDAARRLVTLVDELYDRGVKLVVSADSDAPEHVDYDLWLGPAPKRAFNRYRFHGNWRWFFDTGCGDLGNDGVHRMDYCRWVMGITELPTAVNASGGKFYFDDAQEWPDTMMVTYEYPGKILVYEMRIWSEPRLHDQGIGDGRIGHRDTGDVEVRGQHRGPARGQADLGSLAGHSGGLVLGLEPQLARPRENDQRRAGRHEEMTNRPCHGECSFP